MTDAELNVLYDTT